MCHLWNGMQKNPDVSNAASAETLQPIETADELLQIN
jgi:hypothetical protein